MPTLDRQNGTVVVRIVFDGKPFSGKTTSLRALGGSLGRTVISPEERDGRTLLFDWLDYTAGLFEGFQVRCQVVSVPGQRTFLARRRHLLAQADAVVLVADTTRPGLDETLEQADDLLRFLRGLPGPPVGVVFQANKRDLPDSVPTETLRRLAGPRGLALVESVATHGTGVRESFVFAVRLALDRVREMARMGTLPEGRPEVDSAGELLQEIRRGDEGGLAAESLREVLAAAPFSKPAEIGAPALCPPFQLAPSGMIWPPVEGRVLLGQAFAEPVPLQRSAEGGWEALPGGAFLFLRGAARLRAVELALPVTLETLGETDGKPVFVGLVPFRVWERGEEGGWGQGAEDLLREQVEPVLRRALASRPLEVSVLLSGLEPAAGGDPGLRDTARELSLLLAQL